MSTNPSHILIARNGRGTNNPAASLSSPTETHAAAAGIFRSTGSPPLPGLEHETDEFTSDYIYEDEEEAIEIEETFTRSWKFPGTVKIIVENTTFWAHKEVLFFASPFFEAALSGDWAETGGGRPKSTSSVITISQPPSVPGEGPMHEITEMKFMHESDSEESGSDAALLSQDEKSVVDASVKEQARGESLSKLQGSTGSTLTASQPPSGPPRGRRRRSNGPDATITLREERATIFHDFLKFAYPHLECNITWNNVEGLMNISHKLSVPALQKECLTFLLTHAAGKPIKAMRIAELFDEEELYRESSRFVLDNPGGWPEHEMSTLSPATLLKLEKRRNWFLERVLKLGLTPIAKEYQCCPTCPDPASCAKQLDERWRHAYNSIFRFGPCQPSMVFRYLRNLEGISPPLALTNLTCQNTAKSFASTLFDRMFSLGIRGSGTDSVPMKLGARVGAAASVGPRRHFLYCTLKDESASRTKKSRDFS